MRTLASILFLLGASTAGLSAQERTAHATLLRPDGTTAGTVDLTETPHDGVLLTVRLDGPVHGPAHAIHIHETGACAPTFDAAGDHFAPDGKAHGLLYSRGSHAGDLANLHVSSTSAAVVSEQLAPGVTLEEDAEGSLFDGDGSAIVVHEGADDYESQPAGAAGAPILCGVIER